MFKINMVVFFDKHKLPEYFFRIDHISFVFIVKKGHKWQLPIFFESLFLYRYCGCTVNRSEPANRAEIYAITEARGIEPVIGSRKRAARQRPSDQAGMGTPGASTRNHMHKREETAETAETANIQIPNFLLFNSCFRHQKCIINNLINTIIKIRKSNLVYTVHNCSVNNQFQSLQTNFQVAVSFKVCFDNGIFRFSKKSYL